VILAEVADHIATVTLNRPQSRNALNRATQYALWDAIASADADPDVRVVILTGAGPAFCAGVDLKEVSGEQASSVPPREPGEPGPGREATGLYRFLPATAKPVIAAINGPAVTGGLEVALQCTFLVASERARFADTHGRIGVMPGGGMTVLLAQAVGVRKAIELSLTGNFLTADEAYDLGLVNHVVPHEELLPFTRQLAADIASCDPRSVATLLAHYRRVAGAATLDEAHLLEGLMAETWLPGTSLVKGRREQVTARGREQAGTTAADGSAAGPTADGTA
jgi:enoyl-CoA hydratase